MTKLEEQLTAENVVLREALKRIHAESQAPDDTSTRDECLDVCGTILCFADEALRNTTPQVEALQELVDATLKFVNLSKDISDEKVSHLAAVGMNPTKFEMIKAVRKYKETL